MEKLERYLVVAGITVLLAFLAARFQLMYASFDTGWRDLGHGGIAAAGALDILCSATGLVVLASRRRRTTVTFRIVFLLNTLLAIPLVWELVEEFILHRQ